MVKMITNLGRNGMSDWMIQRLSAIVMIAYFVLLAALFIAHPQLDYLQWHALYSQTWFKILSVLFLLSLISHAWIGMWTVLTDYIKCPVGRLILQILITGSLIIFFIAGIVILWSN